MAAVMTVGVDELGLLRHAFGFAEVEPGVGPFLAVTDPNHRFGHAVGTPWVRSRDTQSASGRWYEGGAAQTNPGPWEKTLIITVSLTHRSLPVVAGSAKQPDQRVTYPRS